MSAGRMGCICGPHNALFAQPWGPTADTLQQNWRFSLFRSIWMNPPFHLLKDVANQNTQRRSAHNNNLSGARSCQDYKHCQKRHIATKGLHIPQGVQNPSTTKGLAYMGLTDRPLPRQKGKNSDTNTLSANAFTTLPRYKYTD